MGAADQEMEPSRASRERELRRMRQGTGLGWESSRKDQARRHHQKVMGYGRQEKVPGLGHQGMEREHGRVEAKP